MALEVTVTNDMFPAETEFEIVGLGVFKNGEATEVSEDAERRFVSLHQKSAEDALGTSELVSVSGSTTIENLDDVLGVDISDRPAPPDLEAITAANQESEDAPVEEEPAPQVVDLPQSVTTTSSATTPDEGSDT